MCDFHFCLVSELVPHIFVAIVNQFGRNNHSLLYPKTQMHLAVNRAGIYRSGNMGNT